MEITKPMILEGDEPLSKALGELMDTCTAVVVTKDQKYYGIIDDRNLRFGISDPGKTKCETCVVKPPTLSSGATILEQINAFMQGHFKALPVIEADGKPLGITTRADVLREMVKDRLIPKVRVSEVMSSPVYTIDEKEQIAKAKGLFKENDCHRLVVTRNGLPTGIISTIDLASFMTKPKRMPRKPYVVTEVETTMTKPVSEFLRYDFTSIPEASTVEEAAERMAEKNVSSIIVIADKKPVGILTATDIFKKIQEIAKEEISISVSGLDGDNIWKYPDIRAKIAGILGKFTSSFNMRKVSVHIKEKKTTFEVFIYFETDGGHISLSTERRDLKEAVDELAAQLHTVLLKKKEKKRTKARKVHGGKEEEAI